jgi:hypothetical protein
MGCSVVQRWRPVTSQACVLQYQCDSLTAEGASVCVCVYMCVSVRTLDTLGRRDFCASRTLESHSCTRWNCKAAPMQHTAQINAKKNHAGSGGLIMPPALLAYVCVCEKERERGECVCVFFFVCVCVCHARAGNAMEHAGSETRIAHNAWLLAKGV